MSLRINQNVLSLKTHSTLTATSSRLEKSIEKLSSGLRINRAADDAAGLAISEKMRRQSRGLSRAILNAQDGVSMIQSAEGALNESQSILQRMRELAIQASNDTLTSSDRLEIQKEVTQLRDDLNRISSNTEFNTKKLLDGSQSALVSGSSQSARGVVTGTPGSGDYQVSIALLSGGVSEMQRSQTFTIAGTGALAQGNTQLQSIAQFYDANGVFAIGISQKLVVNGNAESSELVVNGQMTVDQLTASIQNAITSASGLEMSGSRANFIGTAQTGVAEMGGYFQVTSGVIGEDGHLSFAGDQSFLNALGMNVTREAKNSLVEVMARDAFGNVTTVNTDSSTASGLLAGVDLKFESQAAQVAGLGGLEMGLTWSTPQTFNIVAGGGVANGGGSATITLAAGDWSMEQIARAVATGSAATITGLTTAVVDGQLRISFASTNSAASSIDISGATAAQTIGLQNGTYGGFVQGAKDTSAEILGISRYANQAAATVVFTIGDHDNSYVFTAYTTMSTNTTADFTRFSTLQASINATLALPANSVSVRVDQSGNSLAFTSLRVGQENTTTGATASIVSLQVNNTYAQSKFGFAASTSAKGSGDANFRIHVVSNQPSFQIGADQGQQMNISIGNMSAEALGVDNLDMTSIESAQKSLSKIGKALDRVSAERSKLGAYQNRLEYAINNLTTTHSNITSAESRIRDADIAQEMIEFTRNQIISQSGTAMLAQANMVPQGVLTLLQ
ncbi:MAG TPA: flagellin [Candidatus Ozemobacteraceae bacterium]|nr:flagellin [Candidatus Ozemobacteraceae bacterium]